MKIVLIGVMALLVHTSAAQSGQVNGKTAATTLKPIQQNTPKTASPAKPSQPAAKRDNTAASKASNKPKAVEYIELDLNTINPPLPIIIKAPLGSTVTFDQGVVLTAPDTTYSIIIDMSYSEAPATIAQRRKDAQENQMFTLSKFIIDKPDLLLYETRYEGSSAYHFEMARDIRGERYYLHDHWVAGRAFTQKQIEAMVKAASEAYTRP